MASTVPLLLDSTVYPHILDNIIFQSDYDTLLHLRGISSYLKRKSDQVLNCGRIILWTDFSQHRRRHPTNAIKVSNVDGMIPAFAEWGCTSPREASRISKIDRDVPASHSSATTSYLEALRADLSYTSTIDLVAVIGNFPPYTEALIRARLQSRTISPLTVRVIQPPLGPTENLPSWLSRPFPWSKLPTSPSGTIVQFTRLPDLIKAEAGFLDERPPAVCAPKRVVRNIAFHPDDTKGQGPMARWHASTPRGTESVYIFHRAPEAVRYDGGAEFARDTRHLLHLVVVRLVMDLMATPNLSPTLVVQVDALAGVPSGPGERGFATKEDFLDNCRGVVSEARQCLTRLSEQPSLNHQEVQAAIEGIKFMSLDEYGAAVGPVRAALETTVDCVWF